MIVTYVAAIVADVVMIVAHIVNIVTDVAVIIAYIVMIVAFFTLRAAKQYFNCEDVESCFYVVPY